MEIHSVQKTSLSANMVETGYASGSAATHQYPPTSDTPEGMVLVGVSSLKSLSLVSVAMLAACGGRAPGGMSSVDSTSAAYQPLLGSPRPAAIVQSGRAAPASPTADEFMNWAEDAFSVHFPGRSTTQVSGALAYRFYPQTGNYVGVLGFDVLVLGPPTGNKVVTVGMLADFAGQVAASGPATKITEQEAARFLLQAQFSSSDAEIASVQQKGFALWLQEQYALARSQSAWDWLVVQGYSVVDINEYVFAQYPGDFAGWYQIMGAPDAVRQRAALALSELFVISLNNLSGIDWPSFCIANHWDILCTNAFGNYRTLLEQITLSPAMGAYLNTRGNRKEDPTSGRLPDENYAREVMQLFSIGLNQLNLDGTAKLSSTGQPLDSYTQADVSNLARVFTGYNTITTLPKSVSPKPPNNKLENVETARIPMVLDAGQHSPLQKSFLGVTIPANTSGQDCLKIALDTLFNHPNVGPFLGRQMIQRLVTSNPSAAYVARVASAFNSNPQGVRGDLGHMFKTILLDNEARGPAGLASPEFGKLREPMVRIAQWARTFKLRSVYGNWKVFNAINANQAQDSLAQSPLQAPSVFNFFRPGYVPPSTALANSKATAPEFQIVNESTTSSYINYLQNIVYSGYVSADPTLPHVVTRTPDQVNAIVYVPVLVPDYSVELAMAHDTQALVKRLNLLLCADQLSPTTVQFITKSLAIDKLTVNSSVDFKRIHVARAIMFVMCCAEYLVQK